MNKKELIGTNTICYKIHNFFRKIFLKNKYQDNKNNQIQVEQENRNFVQSISYKNEITNFNKKKKLAESLMNGNLSVMDLSNREVDEMIKYFEEYINEINQNLNKIKNI